MPTLCYDTLVKLSNRPHFERFRASVEQILAARGDDLAFIVLFGSMATGKWMPYSDYDLLIGLNRDDGVRFIDRIGEFQQFVQTAIDVFPYSKSEWQRMFENYHLLLLEALDKGVVLWDDGSFAEMLQQFQLKLREGTLQRKPRGWRVCRDKPLCYTNKGGE
jgi:predicted nucleotidyltransferase